MKHLKIQHLSSNPKNTAALSSTKNIQIFEIKIPPKNTPLIPVCKYATSTPPPPRAAQYIQFQFRFYEQALDLVSAFIGNSTFSHCLRGNDEKLSLPKLSQSDCSSIPTNYIYHCYNWK